MAATAAKQLAWIIVKEDVSGAVKEVQRVLPVPIALLHAVEVQQVIPVLVVLMTVRPHVKRHAKTLVQIHVKAQLRENLQQVRLKDTNM